MSVELTKRAPTGIIAVCACVFACTAVISMASCESRCTQARLAAEQAHNERLAEEARTEQEYYKAVGRDGGTIDPLDLPTHLQEKQ